MSLKPERHTSHSCKEYWLRELYLGLKVTASFDRMELYVRVIDGQVRCITPDFRPKDLHVAWNVQYVVVFAPAWMVPPMYHSLRRESIKNTDSGSATGVSIRPTWLQQLPGDLHQVQCKGHANPCMANGS